MSYIDQIEVIKNGKKHINFRKTFIVEYANLFNNKRNNASINIEVSVPMTREKIKKYIKKIQLKYPIDYQESKKEQLNDKQFILKYDKRNYFNELFKLIPIIDKKGLLKVTHYGLIEVLIVQ